VFKNAGTCCAVATDHRSGKVGACRLLTTRCNRQSTGCRGSGRLIEEERRKHWREEKCGFLCGTAEKIQEKSRWRKTRREEQPREVEEVEESSGGHWGGPADRRGEDRQGHQGRRGVPFREAEGTPEGDRVSSFYSMEDGSVRLGYSRNLHNCVVCVCFKGWLRVYDDLDLLLSKLSISQRSGKFRELHIHIYLRRDLWSFWAGVFNLRSFDLSLALGRPSVTFSSVYHNRDGGLSHTPF
jgi:hypothetical protein